MTPELEQHVARIEGLQGAHVRLLSQMLKADGRNWFGLDFLATAAAKRSMSLCTGFAALVRAKNYTCAASLLRLQLDSCLRFYAAFLVESPHDFAIQILEGMEVRKIKDRKGNLMNDKYLADTLGAQYAWMPNVYVQTSGFIHLSNKHMLVTLEAKETEGEFGLIAGASDEHIAEELWVELSEAFLECTDVLFQHLSGWIFTKTNPEVVLAGRPPE